MQTHEICDLKLICVLNLPYFDCLLLILRQIRSERMETCPA